MIDTLDEARGVNLEDSPEKVWVDSPYLQDYELQEEADEEYANNDNA